MLVVKFSIGKPLSVLDLLNFGYVCTCRAATRFTTAPSVAVSFINPTSQPLPLTTTVIGDVEFCQVELE